eukprot:1794753-Amphidinium_carterae.1
MKQSEEAANGVRAIEAKTRALQILHIVRERAWLKSCPKSRIGTDVAHDSWQQLELQFEQTLRT